MLTTPTKTYDSVLCFGDSDWWYHNRGHADMQYIRRFAKSVPTVYVNSLGVQMPSTSDGKVFWPRVLRKGKSIARYYRDGGEGFDVLSPIFMPTGNGFVGRSLIKGLELQIKMILRLKKMKNPLIWVACPTAAKVLDRVPHGAVVYQYSDFYTAFSGGTSGQANQHETIIARQSDVILCVSDKLYEHAQGFSDRAEYLDHGVDFDLFHAAIENPQRPQALQDVHQPMIGFFGNIDGNTVDRELLDQVIQSRLQYTFVLVGSMAKEFETLLQHKNVIVIPRQPYHEVAQYGAAFDVCLMPWLQNEWIAHCNPIKLKEYLALGKPVVSTPFPELSRYTSLCYVANSAQAFAEAIDQALAEDSPDLHKQRCERAREHTWDAKYDQVIKLLEKHGITAHG